VRQVFRDPGQQALFDERGYIFHDFLSAGQVEQLRGIYASTAGAGRETYDFASKLTYYISVFDKSPEHRKAANDAISSLFKDLLGDVLIDYRILCCNFMVKAPGGGEIQAHQDYTWVDESRHVAFNLWVPLQDTDDTNGCFHLIPGSHRFIEDSYRASTVRETLVAHNQELKAYMVPVPVPAGRGILFDHRLFHYSPDNLSNVPRVAAQLVLIPVEAQPVMAHFRPEDPDHVRLLAIADDSYLTEKNLWDIDPDGLVEVARRPFRKLPDRDELLAIVRQHTAGSGVSVR
jgi:hypothetical protein